MISNPRALKQAEPGRFRMIADGIPFMIWVHGPHGRQEFVNRAYCEFFGVERDAMVGQSWQTLVHPDDKDAYIAEFLACERDRRPFHAEARVLRADGQWRWVESFGNPQFSPTGEFLGMVGTSPDITERKQAEEALRKSEERLSLAVSAGRLATWDGHMATGEVVWNDEHFRMMGYKPGEVTAGYQAWAERVHPEDRPAAEASFARALEQGGSHACEFRALWPDGTIRWIEARGHIDRDATGRLVRSYGVLIDMTERKQAEEALRESKSRYQMLHESLRDAFVLVSMDGRVIEFNDLYCRLLGYSPAEMYALTYQELTPSRWHALEEAIVREQILQRGYSDLYEKEYRRKDGTIIPVELRTILERDREGRPTGMWGIVRDITERQQAKETLERTVQERTSKLAATNRELEARTHQLRLLAGELTMSEQRERKRLSKVLHDGMQQYLVAAKLQMEGLITAAADWSIRQSAAEIQHLLDESIRVSRSLAAELSPPILHEAGILAGLEWLSRWMSEKHGLKVQLTMDMHSPALSDDVKVLLFESAREMLLNVVKHSGTHAARIHLSGEGDDRLKVVVSDSGKGFGMEILSAGPGMDGGFGLFSIRERIQLIGGDFEADSAPGRGTRMTLTVPLGVSEPSAAHPAADPGGGAARPEVPDAHAEPTGKIRILITDDHAVMREGLSRLLSQERDFEVIGEASDGREAVEKAAALCPDIILMDISMPHLDGIEATRIIRHRSPGVRIIGLSLYSAEERAKEMLDAGAVFYMTKSGPAADLKRTIRACMGDGAATARV